MKRDEFEQRVEAIERALGCRAARANCAPLLVDFNKGGNVRFAPLNPEVVSLPLAADEKMGPKRYVPSCAVNVGRSRSRQSPTLTERSV